MQNIAIIVLLSLLALFQTFVDGAVVTTSTKTTVKSSVKNTAKSSIKSTAKSSIKSTVKSSIKSTVKSSLKTTKTTAKTSGKSSVKTSTTVKVTPPLSSKVIKSSSSVVVTTQTTSTTTTTTTTTTTATTSPSLPSPSCPSSYPIQSTGTVSCPSTCSTSSLCPIAKNWLDLHNFERSNPSSLLGHSSVPAVKWSCFIEATAYRFAKMLVDNGCGLKHSCSWCNGGFTNDTLGGWQDLFGENLFWSGGKLSEVEAANATVNAWVNERVNYDQDGVTCKGGWYNCGHHSQVMWHSTTKIGCASYAGSCGTVAVCQYSKPGNCAIKNNLIDWPGLKPDTDYCNDNREFAC